MVCDIARGRVRELAGRPQIRYDLRPATTRARFQRGIELLARSTSAAGAREVIVPVDARADAARRRHAAARAAPLRAGELALMAFHPLGTAARARDPAASVVDARAAASTASGGALRAPTAASCPRRSGSTRRSRSWRSPRGSRSPCSAAGAGRARARAHGRAPAGDACGTYPLARDGDPRPGAQRAHLRAVRRRRRRRRHHRRRGARWTRPAAATPSRSSRSATSPRAPRAARASSCTAGCATCRSSTSGSCARRCSSASCMVSAGPAPGAAAAAGRPRLRGRRPRPPRRRRAEHVRRHGDRQAPPAAAAPARRAATARGREWSPDRHRTIDGDEVRRAAPRAGAAQPELRLPLLRLPDRRRPPRPDRAGRGRALRRGLRQPASRSTELVERRRARRDRRRDRRGAADPRRQRDQRHRGVGRPRAPEELHDEAEVPDIRPSRGTHITLSPDDLPLAPARSCPPAAGARSSRCRGSGARWSARPTTTTRARSTTSPPADDDIAYMLDAINAFFGTDLGARRPDRRLRGRAAADLLRRPQEVGRHLAQGRALRDLERHDHDHRRQAHDLAAHGEDGGRPARRARRRATRRAARTRSRSGRRSTPSELPRVEGVPEDAYGELAARYGYAAHDVLARRRASAASWPSRSSPACPTCWPRSSTRRGASRRARWATCCCGAPGSGCWPRTSCWTRTERRRGGAAGGADAGPELGWDDARVEREIAGFASEAGAEGILVSASIGARP